MFSRIFHRMDAVKQVNSGEEATIRLASIPLKRKAENVELSNTLRVGTKPQKEG